MQDQELITIDRFATAAQARVACDYLQAHGVDALMMEQDRLRFNPLRPSRAPGIRVVVRSGDEVSARALLAAVEAQGESGEGHSAGHSEREGESAGLSGC